MNAVVRALVTAAAVAAFALAAQAEIDLSPIAARAAAGAADSGTSRADRARYQALAKKLAKADAPGLRDDFSKLERAAELAAGPLADDPVLVSAVRAGLLDGVAALAGVCDATDAVAAQVEPGRDRARVDALTEDGHADSRAAETAAQEDRLAPACRLANRATRRLARATQLAEKLVAQQANRPARWRTIFDGLQGSLLGVWADGGPMPRVYTVGAHDASGPTFLRCVGNTWERVPVPGTEDLWWVSGVPGDGVWTSGTHGAVFRFDPATGDMDDRATGVNATLFGVWGTSATDVWAVGGDLDGVGPQPALLHWNGTQWAAVPHPPEAEGRTLFKVWGTASDDVWACGQMGTILHWDGVVWSSVASGTQATLLTVHGGTRTTAVGGGVGAVIVERGAGGAFDVAPTPVATELLNGIHVPQSGGETTDAWAVGYFGTVMRRTPDGWFPFGGAPRTSGRHHHAVHVDDTGGVWIAGGDLFHLDQGALLYYGPRKVPLGN